MQVGRMDHDFEQEPFGVHEQMPLARRDLLGPVKPMRAPCSVVLTG
jgi:hypothetical protein